MDGIYKTIGSKVCGYNYLPPNMFINKTTGAMLGLLWLSKEKLQNLQLWLSFSHEDYRCCHLIGSIWGVNRQTMPSQGSQTHVGESQPEWDFFYTFVTMTSRNPLMGKQAHTIQMWMCLSKELLISTRDLGVSCRGGSLFDIYISMSEMQYNRPPAGGAIALCCRWGRTITWNMWEQNKPCL